VAVVVAAVAGVTGLAAADAGSAPASGCPTGWVCTDVGDPAPTGGQAVTGSTWQVEGGGADIWGTADAFHYVYEDMAGDGSVSTRVVSQSDSDQNAKAGVMVRAGTDPASAYYAVFLTPGHGLVTQYRTTTGAVATNAGGAPVAVPSFLDVVRAGDTFTSMVSSDGTTWTKVSGSTEVLPGLAGTLLAGLAVTSHDTAVVGAATFGSVTVVGGSPPAGASPAAPATTAAVDPTAAAPTTAAGTGPAQGSAPAGTGEVPTGTSSTGPAAPTTTTTTSSTGATVTSPAKGSTGNTGKETTDASTAGQVTVCGTALCVGSTPWSMYGSTIYNPGLTPYQSGIEDPSGTVALVEKAHLNTIRITDYLNDNGNPATSPYNEQKWEEVDAMIAAAGAAGLHVDLGLSDYRAMLWNDCENPYKADWSQFVDFVANRVNTVTHVVYKDDPTIAFVSVAGEPLPVGSHVFTASTTGQGCTLNYTSADLTSFYSSIFSEWTQTGASVLINSGGLGYLNEDNNGIQWKTIFNSPGDAFCDIKTYGGMQAWAPTAADFCRSIGKPLVVEEFGWQQDEGDAQRAALFTAMFSQLRAMGVAGTAFWNLGYQIAPTSYEVNPSTPKTLAAVVANAPLG
jgi:hypothetical protein